jgi:hypothetical protein
LKKVLKVNGVIADGIISLKKDKNVDKVCFLGQRSIKAKVLNLKFHSSPRTNLSMRNDSQSGTLQSVTDRKIDSTET